MLLIVGGSKDHNIARLADAAKWRGHPYRLVHTDKPLSVSWQPGSPDITINGETFKAEGTSLFIRYDVFGRQADGVKTAVYDAIKGWAEAHPQVGLFNRANETMEVSKPRALVLAQQCGFDIPKTWITEDFNRFAEKNDYIAKPVSGGEYTRVLSDMPDSPGRPYIVQEKLAYPELRLFRAGRHFFAFQIECNVIDYRVSDDFTMTEVQPPAQLAAAMQKLTDRMGLDYAAADFKTDPATGKLLFLEVNTMPMFTGYDDVAKGRLSDAMFLALKKLGNPAQQKKKSLGPVL